METTAGGLRFVRYPVEGWIKYREYGKEVWYDPSSFRLPDPVNIMDVIEKFEFDENGRIIEDERFENFKYDEAGNLI